MTDRNNQGDINAGSTTSPTNPPKGKDAADGMSGSGSEKLGTPRSGSPSDPKSGNPSGDPSKQSSQSDESSHPKRS